MNHFLVAVSFSTVIENMPLAPTLITIACITAFSLLLAIAFIGSEEVSIFIVVVWFLAMSAYTIVVYQNTKEHLEDKPLWIEKVNEEIEQLEMKKIELHDYRMTDEKANTYSNFKEDMSQEINLVKVSWKDNGILIEKTLYVVIVYEDIEKPYITFREIEKNKIYNKGNVHLYEVYLKKGYYHPTLHLPINK